jgi:AcrR family transcriptional regulator
MDSRQAVAASGPVRVRRPEQKRAQLLHAAQELFAANGFEATTTAEIARQAGMSEGVLFHQFGTKRGLYDQLADDYGRDLATSLALESETEITEEMIVCCAFAFADRNPRLYQLFAISGPKLDEFGTTPVSATLVAAIEARLKRDMANGEARPGHTQTMAELQFAVVDACYRAWSRDPDPKHRDQYIDEAAHSMKAMLAPRTPS